MSQEKNNNPEIQVNAIEELIKKNSQSLQIPKETYLKILKASIIENAADIKLLEEAISTGNYDAIQPLAHKLKGVFGNLQLGMLAQPAVAIDALAKKKEGIDEIKRHFTTLTQTFEQFRILSG